MNIKFVAVCILPVILSACKQDNQKYLNPSDVFGVTDTLRSTILPEILMVIV